MQRKAESVFSQPCRRRHACALGDCCCPFLQVTLADRRKLGLDEKQHSLEIFALCFGYFHNLSVDSFYQFVIPFTVELRMKSVENNFSWINSRFYLVIFGFSEDIYSFVTNSFSCFFRKFRKRKCKPKYTVCINMFSHIRVENRVEKVDNLTRKACFINISECGKLLLFF